MAPHHEQNPRRDGYQLSAVPCSRLTRRGILLGLSLSQLMTLAVGVLSMVGALYAGGCILFAFASPIWLLAAGLTWVPVGRRNLIEWVPLGFRWAWRVTGGQLIYRRRVVKPRPAGTRAQIGRAP